MRGPLAIVMVMLAIGFFVIDKAVPVEMKPDTEAVKDIGKPVPSTPGGTPSGDPGLGSPAESEEDLVPIPERLPLPDVEPTPAPAEPTKIPPFSSPQVVIPDLPEPSVTPQPFAMPELPLVESAPPQPQWMSAIFPVRQVNMPYQENGTAVSLGGGKLLTAAHVLKSNNYPDVGVNGSWIRAGYTRTPNRDIATLAIADTSLPGVETRAPVYGETATAYGLKTQKPMRGTISDFDALALDPNEPGVDEGDSGGGVFGDDGRLLGTIRAHRKGNQRVVLFEPIQPTPAYQQSQAPAPQAVAQPNCANGQCTVPYSRPRLFRR